MITRRTFLRTSLEASSLAAVAGQAGQRGHFIRHTLLGGNVLGELPKATDPEFKTLAMRALDAAKAAGATYADVRFTVTKRRTFSGIAFTEEGETVAIGVRALAKGTWGFASETTLTADIAARLGRKATEQAKGNAWPHTPPIELVDRPNPVVGHWVMPVKRDPFTVPVDETVELLEQLDQDVTSIGGIQLHLTLTFQCQERVFASTEGAYATQTIYTSFGGVPHSHIPASRMLFTATDALNRESSLYAVPQITPTGVGYEALEDLHVLDHVEEWTGIAQALLDAKRFDRVGQYDVVFDGDAMAAIVNGTFGTALEYDRAIGYEADSGGTSYLAPPLQVLGTEYAPAAVTITADRNLAGGAATVRWDDDGVTPVTTPLIQKGMLVDYATSREFVGELAPWYKKRGETIRSNGCAASESAANEQLVGTPNLVLHPGASNASLTDLIAQVDDGFVVMGGSVMMDMQLKSGRGTGARMYVIKHGRLVGQLSDAVYMFRTQELWEKLVTLGGSQSAMTRGMRLFKGQPNQITTHSVQTVAAHFRDVQINNSAHI